jgi:hypothetical protein
MWKNIPPDLMQNGSVSEIPAYAPNGQKTKLDGQTIWFRIGTALEDKMRNQAPLQSPNENTLVFKSVPD